MAAATLAPGYGLIVLFLLHVCQAEQDFREWGWRSSFHPTGPRWAMGVDMLHTLEWLFQFHRGQSQGVPGAKIKPFSFSHPPCFLGLACEN